MQIENRIVYKKGHFQQLITYFLHHSHCFFIFFQQKPTTIALRLLPVEGGQGRSRTCYSMTDVFILMFYSPQQ